jgi:hypothetical protein
MLDEEFHLDLRLFQFFARNSVTVPVNMSTEYQYANHKIGCIR